MKYRNLDNYQNNGMEVYLECCISSYKDPTMVGTGRKSLAQEYSIQNQKSISDEAALPQDTPSSTGSRIVSWVLEGPLELWTDEG